MIEVSIFFDRKLGQFFLIFYADKCFLAILIIFFILCCPNCFLGNLNSSFVVFQEIPGEVSLTITHYDSLYYTMFQAATSKSSSKVTALPKVKGSVTGKVKVNKPLKVKDKKPRKLDNNIQVDDLSANISSDSEVDKVPAHTDSLDSNSSKATKRACDGIAVYSDKRRRISDDSLDHSLQVPS